MKFSTNLPIEEIDLQTKRILEFAMFKKSPVLSRFLEFVIVETVHKREQQIKEYSIAINVLHRGHNFNPNVDSIVRIHAGRLRRALNDYYLTQGIYDPIIIEIPKGCYVPEFYEGNTEKLPAIKVPDLPSHDHKPLVAIFPFRVGNPNEDINEAVLVLKEQLSEELLCLHNVSVIGYYSDEMQLRIRENVLEAGKAAGADYIITGSVKSMSDRMRVIINLLVTATGEVLLCKSFEKSTQSAGMFDVNDIFQNVVEFSTTCSGIISQQRQKHVA